MRISCCHRDVYKSVQFYLKTFVTFEDLKSFVLWGKGDPKTVIPKSSLFRQWCGREVVLGKIRRVCG